MWCGLVMPRPEPMGAPAGITAAQPRSARRRARTGIVCGVRQNCESVVDQLRRGLHQLDRVGQEGSLIADYLEFDPVGVERLPAQPAVRTASAAV